MEMQSLQSKYSNASTTDQAIYAGQFRELQVQLNGLTVLAANHGVSLFSSDPTHKSASTIYTSAQGASGSSITLGNLDYESAFAFGLFPAPAHLGVSPGAGEALNISKHKSGEEITSYASELTTALEEIATLRAQAGGKASTLGFASEYLATKSAGLEAANSRIIDTDIAEESINYSKYSMQYEAAAAALAQSNLTSEVVMDLLLSINSK